MGKWVILAVLCALLVLAGWAFYSNWTEIDIDLPLYAWVALIGAVVVGLAIGIGLMALVFYSSRMGYDEPPRSLDRRDDET
jgi:hypothetical protein